MNWPWMALFLAMLPTGAEAADLRQMAAQPGEWLVTTSGTMLPHITQKVCYRGADAIAGLTTRRLDHCSRKSVEIGAATATIDADCTMSGVHVQMHAIATPTGDAAWRATATVRLEGLPFDARTVAGDFKMTIEAKRIGPCAGGETP